VGNIKYFAKHKKLKVSAGFETKESRDKYIRTSISNGHPWIACEAKDICISCHQNFDENYFKKMRAIY